jgi:SAM-dependent methyltransferase
MQNKWDTKARHYERYTPHRDDLEAIMCHIMGEMGVDFANKRVIDIGCGTGIYTLRAAQQATHIDALDISKEMLMVLKEDAARYAITNVTTHHSDWEAFLPPEQGYDYALSTMSPATREPKGFAKMSHCATTKIFLGWGAKRGTILLEELIASHGETYTPPNGAVHLKAWLEEQNIPYRLREYPEEKVRIRALDKAIEKYAWHLQARDITPDPSQIERVLRRHLDEEGNVVERVVNYFNLIVWE